ncbi:MAG: efflux RND transporter periplasmic adaptor subunit [Candidatus Cloacimonetes bacterium]|nr:efflux RND transporter periplasmic adaptor subunit [Candidatus Cloacimonadota bacterium]
MDRELPVKYQQKRKIIIILRMAAVVVVLTVLLLLFRALLVSSIKYDRIRTAVAEIGSLDATITASGMVVPEYEHALTSPLRTQIDTLYFRAGDSIQVNEQVLKLNTDQIEMEYSRLQDEYELTLNRKDKLQLEMERQLIDLHAQLEIMNLKVKSFEQKLEAQKTAYLAGGGPRSYYEQAQLDYNIALLEQQQLQQRIDNQKRSNQAEQRELDLTLSIQKGNLHELDRQLEQAAAKSQRAGVLTWINDEIGTSVAAGAIIARIADLSRFKIEGKIADIHAGKLVIGNPVRVEIGDTLLEGRISNIRPTVENGIMEFIVELKDNSNQNLRSNLRVDIYIITSSKQDIVRIKNGPFISGSGRQRVFVVEGDKARRREVQIGMTSFAYVEVLEGLAAGEEVIISSTDDYIHRPLLRLKR